MERHVGGFLVNTHEHIERFKVSEGGEDGLGRGEEVSQKCHALRFGEEEGVRP